MNGQYSLFVVAFAVALAAPAGAQDDIEGRFTVAFQGGTDSELAVHGGEDVPGEKVPRDL